MFALPACLKAHASEIVIVEAASQQRLWRHDPAHSRCTRMDRDRSRSDRAMVARRFNARYDQR
jgi:hypothetical protein